MFAVALIVFREVLEASLVVTIILAVTRNVPHRGLWVALGITVGVMGAGLIALLTRVISASFEGAGQEIIDVILLLTAVVMISWHVIWMNSHGREMAKNMRSIGGAISEGTQPIYVVSVIIGLAVMREGSEIVLMLQGLWLNGSSLMMLEGFFVGLSAGVLLGLLIYVGFLALSLKHIFSVTNTLLILIAAGMSAHAANFLAQAGLISSFGSRVWDTNPLLSEESTLGQVMATLIGYIACPSGVEVLFYTGTLLIIITLIFVTRRTSHCASIRSDLFHSKGSM